MKIQKAVTVAAIVATQVLAGYAKAQDQTNQAPDLQSLLKRIEELEKQVKLQKQNEQSEKEALETKIKTVPTITLGGDGLAFSSTDGNYKLKLRGYIQADARFYLDDPAHAFTDTFLLNRVRPVFEGTVFKNFDFKIMPDFGQGKSVIQDAYLDAHFLPELSLRVGKYKSPVGLERLQSARDLIFVERSLPTDLAPNRDLGAALHGDFFKGALSYEAGVFNGAGDGGSDDSDENDSKDVAGRIFAQPFKFSGIKPLQGLGVGVAGTVGNENGVAPSYKTVGQQTLFSFSSGVTARGDRTRISPQGYYYWGPFGLLGEYIVSSELVNKSSKTERLDNSAWQVTASFVLTGEKASYTGVSPLRPFSPAAGQWGAFELAARVGELDVDSDAFRNFGTNAKPNRFADPTISASQASFWGVGVNWYLNRSVKFQIDYDRTHFKGGAVNGDRREEQALFSRIQLAF